MILAATDLSLTALLPRLFLSMAVVIGVMWIAARLMRNRQFSGGGIVRKPASQKAAPAVQVVAKQGLSKSASITVVRVGDKELVLGVTDSSVSLLAESPALALESDLSGRFSHAGARFDDESRMQSEIQGTGTPRKTTSAVVSSSARKGLLEQVRELTVRR